MPTAPLVADPARPENARLAMLYEVSQSLSASLDLSETLALVLDAALRLTGAERGFLMLWDEENERLVFHLARSSSGDALTEFEFQISRTLIYSVAQNGAPILTTNSQTHTLFERRPDSPPFVLRSFMAVPLRSRGQSTGVIYVDNPARSAKFRAPDLDYLSAFAAPAAIAIENARLHTHTAQALNARVTDLQAFQQFNRDLSTTPDLATLLQTTLTYAITHTHATVGWVGLADAGALASVVTKTLSGRAVEVPPPGDDPLARQALTTGEPQRTATHDEVNASRVVVPVLRGGVVRAVIAVARPGDDPFTYAAEEFLVRLAEQAALILEAVRLTAALQQVQADKNKFIAIVTHELKIPMTPIKGYADLLLQGIVGPVTDQQKQFLVTIRNNVERMAELVNNLADIARLETGRLKTEFGDYAPADLLREAVDGFKLPIEEKGLALTVNIHPGLPPVRADKARVVQVLKSLLANALAYTPAGGTLTLSAAPQSGWVRLSVADTGIGMAPADQIRLFTQFFRSEDAVVRDRPGWGLSLHLSKLLVELMGGQLTATSELGRGSEFGFTLPVTKD